MSEARNWGELGQALWQQFEKGLPEGLDDQTKGELFAGSLAGRVVGNALKGAWNFMKVPGDVAAGKYAPHELSPLAANYGLELGLMGMGVPRPPGTLGAFGAWHGTDRPFREFQDEAIGSGQGAQSYGWGHYVAGNPEVAESYAGMGGKEPHMLEVHVRPEESELLDWDSPKQSPEIMEKVKKAYIEGWGTDVPEHILSDGEYIYQDLAEKFGDREASKLLHEAGIPGIKFKDQLSRGLPDIVKYTGEEPLPDLLGKHMGSSSLDPISADFDIIVKLSHEIGDPRSWHNEYGSRIADPVQRERYLEGAKDQYRKAIEFVQNNGEKFQYVEPPGVTRNYVIFHPSNLEIRSINGHPLEPVDHNPFEE